MTVPVNPSFPPFGSHDSLNTILLDSESFCLFLVISCSGRQGSLRSVDSYSVWPIFYHACSYSMTPSWCQGPASSHSGCSEQEKRNIDNTGMLDVYCRVVSPENKHESSNIQTDQVIFRDICSTDTFIHVTTASEKEAMNLKAIREDYMTKFGAREGNDRCNIIISRIKNILHCQKGQ